MGSNFYLNNSIVNDLLLDVFIWLNTVQRQNFKSKLQTIILGESAYNEVICITFPWAKPRKSYVTYRKATIRHKLL